MKLTISYQPHEAEAAKRIVDAVQGMNGNRFKVRQSDKHPPHKHIYLASTNAVKPL